MFLPTGFLYALTGIATGLAGLAWPPRSGARSGAMIACVLLACATALWGMKLDRRQAQELTLQANLIKDQTASLQRQDALLLSLSSGQTDSAGKIADMQQKLDESERAGEQLSIDNATTHALLAATQSELHGARQQITDLSVELAQKNAALADQVSQVDTAVREANSLAERTEERAKADEARRVADATLARYNEICRENDAIIDSARNSLLDGGGCACRRYFSAADMAAGASFRCNSMTMAPGNN